VLADWLASGLLSSSQPAALTPNPAFAAAAVTPHLCRPPPPAVVHPLQVRCRGQINPHAGKLVYVMEITALGFDDVTGCPFARADVDILDINYEKGQRFDSVEDRHLFGRGDPEKKIVVDFHNIALQIQPRDDMPAATTVTPTTATAASAAQLRQGCEQMVAASSGAFRSPPPPASYLQWGTELQTLEGRRRTQLQLQQQTGTAHTLSWHPLAGRNGNPVPGFTPTAYVLIEKACFPVLQYSAPRRTARGVDRRFVGLSVCLPLSLFLSLSLSLSLTLNLNLSLSLSLSSFLRFASTNRSRRAVETVPPASSHVFPAHSHTPTHNTCHTGTRRAPSRSCLSRAIPTT
jgi:hypothetical protein